MFRAEVVLKRCLLLAGCAITMSAFAQFETRSTTSIAGEPISVALADFNHDGKLDVAVANYNGQLAILLGRGDGSFRPAVYSPVSYAESIAAADYNHDGNVDLAVVDGLNDYVTVLLGNGDRTFQSPKSYPTTARATFVVAGDFNNDGNPDLVMCDEPYVSVLLGNGDGSFRAPLDNNISFCSQAPGSVAVGDFNADHKLDVVFAGNGAMVLLGNGDGTFRPVVEYPSGVAPNSVAVADFNGDGKPDLAVSDVYGGQVWMLLSNGDGTFQAAVGYPANFPATIQVADFNKDGNADVVVASGSFPSEASVLLGNGDGTLQPAVSYPAGKESGVAVGDLNRDHETDIIVVDFIANSISILLNTGVVSFSPTTPISFPTQLIGTTSAPQNITLTNTGTTVLSIAARRVSGPFQLASGTTCGSSVAPGANCTLSVTFTPTVIGLKSGLLSISDSASIKPQVIELSGSGTVISLSPPQLNFGSQKVGTKSAPQNITVTNTGSTTVSVTSVKIAGNNSKDYSETNTCGSQIAPGASCTISVTFAPIKTGTRSADAQISDDGGGSPQQVSLTGVGD